MKLILIAILLGDFQVTAYRSVPSQTDSTPYYTSTNELVSSDGVAVSQDLICGACKRLHKRCKRPDNPTKLHYQDWLYIDQVGYKRVNDLMNKRHKNRLDVWVRTHKDEKDFDRMFKAQRLITFKIKERYEKETH